MTDLVKRCIGLSKIPVDSFSSSDLRLMVVQQFGLLFLIPIALEKLQDDIFIEADYYEGDLLASILNVDTEFWQQHKEYWLVLSESISDKRQKIAGLKFSTVKFDSVRC